MKNKLIYVLTLVFLACALVFGGCGKTQEPIKTPEEKTVIAEQKKDMAAKETDAVPQQTVVDEAAIGQLPEKEAEQPTEELKNICSLSVRCETVLANKDKLKKEKLAIIPSDGIIYAEKEVEFTPGESAFDVLLREMKGNKIHMEFNETPMYKSVYIEGIGNLYEFDCGELSGWTYLVNGKMQGVGCSQCYLQPGDKVEFLYTCNLGRDIGGSIGK